MALALAVSLGGALAQTARTPDEIGVELRRLTDPNDPDVATEERGAQIVAVIEKLVAADPERAIELARTLDRRTTRPFVIEAFAATVRLTADEGVDASLKRVNTTPAVADREAAALGVARGYAKRDPRAALDLLERFHIRSRVRGRFRDLIYSDLAELDPELAERLKAEKASARGRRTAYQHRKKVTAGDRVVGSVPDPEPPSVAVAESLPPGSQARAKMFGELVPLVAETNPGNALLLLHEVTTSNQRRLSRAVVNEWTKRDPQSALRFLEAHPECNARYPKGLDRVRRVIVEAVTHGPPAPPTRVSPQEERPSPRLLKLRPIAKAKCDTDSEAALEWLASLSPADYEWIAPQVIHLLARDLPEKSAGLADAFEGGLRESALALVVWQWGLIDADAALRWISEHVKGVELRARLDWLALAQWVDTDAPGAWEYLSRQPVDHAMSLLVRSSHDRKWSFTIDYGSLFVGYDSKSCRVPEHPRRFQGEISSSKFPEQLGRMLIAQLPCGETQAFVEFLRIARDGDKAWELAKGALTGLAETELERALELAAELGGRREQDFLHGLVGRLKTTSPREAMGLLERLERRGEQHARSIARSWHEYDPHAACAHFDAMPPGAARDAFEKGLGIVDLPKARARIVAAAAGVERNRAFGDYTRQLMRTVPNAEVLAAIDAYLAAESVGRTSGWLNEGFIDKMVGDDPGAFAEWAVKLPKGWSRHRALYNFWSRWEQFGKGSGDLRLAELGLDEEEIVSLRSSVYRGR